MLFAILYDLPKYQLYIYCIHLFMSLFLIPAQSIIGKMFPKLWQSRLEKTQLYRLNTNTMLYIALQKQLYNLSKMFLYKCTILQEMTRSSSFSTKRRNMYQFVDNRTVFFLFWFNSFLMKLIINYHQLHVHKTPGLNKRNLGTTGKMISLRV